MSNIHSNILYTNIGEIKTTHPSDIALCDPEHKYTFAGSVIAYTRCQTTQPVHDVIQRVCYDSNSFKQRC